MASLNEEDIEVDADIEVMFPFCEFIDGFDINDDVRELEEHPTNSHDPQQPHPQELGGNQQGNNTNTPPIEHIVSMAQPQQRHQELCDNTRKLIVQQLISLSKNRVLPKGTIKGKANEWGVSRWTISRLWSIAKKDMALGAVVDVRSKKKGRVGRKPKIFDLEQLKAIPIEKRTTIRALSHALGIAHSTVYRLMKSGTIRSHTNSIKPKLSPEQKHKRMQYVLNQIIPPTVHTLPKFSLMYNIVHLDEKWFEGSKETQRFYLFANHEEQEAEPYRSVQNKNFIGKVMFIAAVARPHIAPNGEVLWDGKIGIFPITEEHVAVRNSSNRPAGTVELRAVTRVTRDVIRHKLISEVLPAIRAKWPTNGVRDIWIQQDNARPHILCNDVAFNEAASQDGFNIRLVCQPPSSPDMNVLDLGFFNAIQSIQFKAFPKDVNALVSAVEDAYHTFEPSILNHTWIQLQLCMLETLKVKGGNNYKSPHIGKQRLERIGALPKQIEVPIELIESTKDTLSVGIIDLNVPQNEED